MDKDKEINSSEYLALFFSFWITEFVVRFVIFGSFLNGVFPGITINGFRVHHYITGFALLFVSIILALFHKRKIFYPLLGISSALIMDEFSYWTILKVDYWNPLNIIAPFSAGIGLLFLLKLKTNFYSLPSIKRAKIHFYFVTSELVLIILLLSHHTLTAQAQEHYSLKTPKSFSQSIQIFKSGLKNHLLANILFATRKD